MLQEVARAVLIIVLFVCAIVDEAAALRNVVAISVLLDGWLNIVNGSERAIENGLGVPDVDVSSRINDDELVVDGFVLWLAEG